MQQTKKTSKVAEIGSDEAGLDCEEKMRHKSENLFWAGYNNNRGSLSNGALIYRYR